MSWWCLLLLLVYVIKFDTKWPYSSDKLFKINLKVYFYELCLLVKVPLALFIQNSPNFWPTSVEVTCATLPNLPKDHCVQLPWKYINVRGYSDHFYKLEPKVIPRCPLNPPLLRLHVWLYQRIMVSNSHWNTLKYVDTVTIFQNFHQDTTYLLHTYCLVRTEWVIT